VDQDRFFYEVDRELCELDYVNGDLQLHANHNHDLNISAMYSEYLQAMMAMCYSQELCDE